MSSPSQPDPRIDQAAVTDQSLLAAHEKLLGKKPDDRGHYRLMPLVLLFVFSGLIFLGGTYLGRFSANFHPAIFNETVHPPKSGEAPAAAPVDPIVLGRGVYAQVCASCHQPNGMGLPPAFPPLANSEWVTGSEDRLIRIVLHGLQGPITVAGTEFNGVMPAAGPGSGFNLSPERIAAVLTFIRQEWGNSAPPVTVDKVNQVRSQTGNRAAWTAAELQQVP